MAENNTVRFKRQAATRMFAAELKQTTALIPKATQDQYESQLFLTPTGAKASRIMIAGAAVEVEDVGKDNKFLRMRVADPTGVFFVSAGQYQPEAARAMEEIRTKIPSFVVVIGKISVYTPDAAGSTPLVSIRAEDVVFANESTRNDWVIETAKLSLDRLAKLKTDTVLAQEVAAAYPEKGSDYKEIVRAALISMQGMEEASKPGDAKKPQEEEKKAPEPPKQEAPPKKDEPAPPAAKPGEMSDDQIDEFVENTIKAKNKRNGVKLDTLNEPCKEKGIRITQLGESIHRLMDMGKIYEPKLGLLMPT